jgi:hypothetical protein
MKPKIFYKQGWWWLEWVDGLFHFPTLSGGFRSFEEAGAALYKFHSIGWLEKKWDRNK